MQLVIIVNFRIGLLMHPVYTRVPLLHKFILGYQPTLLYYIQDSNFINKVLSFSEVVAC